MIEQKAQYFKDQFVKSRKPLPNIWGRIIIINIIGVLIFIASIISYEFKMFLIELAELIK